jgi:hypothetical protein
MVTVAGAFYIFTDSRLAYAERLVVIFNVMLRKPSVPKTRPVWLGLKEKDGEV